MPKTIVLAEKPSVGRDIARVLNCSKKGTGFFEGSNYVVTWAMGHLVTLSAPENYNKTYKNWNLDDLPIMPNRLTLSIIKETSKQYNTVKELLYRNDVNKIVIATDAGREGELVARWILEKSKVNKPIMRLWISSVTDKAIKDGFNNLKDGKLYNNLYYSAVARAESDWLVGINATRALTTKFNAQLSCGRVQTPTLAIIASREDEIRKFKPEKFYGIEVISGNIKFTWHDSKSNDIKTFDKEQRDKIATELKNKTIDIKNIEKTRKKTNAPQLYDLTELQRDANKKYNFSAKETLSIMQKLYETHKLLTYPRTDSRYLTTDILDTLPERLIGCSDGEYKRLAAKINKKSIKLGQGYVDNKKVTDHHAIIPTEQRLNLYDLNEKERKIYDLVVRRFLSIMYPAFEYEDTKIKAQIGNQYFTAKGRRVINPGYKEIYNNKFDEDSEESSVQQLPEIKSGEKLKVSTINLTEGKTKPPAPFNEATLLSAMENPVKYMATASASLKATIGETGGLGTVATRADIIEKLFDTFVIEKTGNDIHITNKGRQLLSLAPQELKQPDLTALWETKLSKISKGELNKTAFLSEIRNYTSQIIKQIKDSTEKFKHDNMTANRCPECGKYMLEVKGKKGKMLICQDRDCGYRKSVSIITNARCPQCHKNMELIGEGDNKKFICSCGHREKQSVFEERRQKEANNLSKKEVENYLKNQTKKQDKVINNPLAGALSKLKF